VCVCVSGELGRGGGDAQGLQACKQSWCFAMLAPGADGAQLLLRYLRSLTPFRW
jgi:hypothetical protein